MVLLNGTLIFDTREYLQCNPSKTENHAVPPRKKTLPPTPKTNATTWSDLDWTVKPTVIEEPATWKKCKLLGSRLDTATDINCRKGRACDVMKKLADKFNSKHLSIATKIGEFRTYVTTIFMYNTELWALTKTDEKRIDSFHRRLLRQAINKKWPKKQCTNEQLYDITNEKPWSETIKRRRLRWTGHLMRLDERTPAKIALHKFAEPQLSKVGRPKNTWLATIKRDFKELILPNNNQEFITKLCEVASDRKEWKKVVLRECGTVRKN